MKSTSIRIASAIGTVSATVVLGVVAARVASDRDSGSSKLEDSTAAIVVDAGSVVETAVNSIETTDVATGGSGGGAVPMGDAAAGAGSMFVDDPIAGPYALSERAFDSCAGSSAGAAVGAGCPVGYAGVLSGGAPPPPFVWGTPGRYLTAPSAPFPEACPASSPEGEDHNAITVFSRTPLTSLTVKWRPYATSDPWVSLITSATPAAELSSWMARFEAADGYSREEFGYLTLCGIHIDRDPDVPYEVVLDAVDSFGRPVSSRPFVMHDGTPSGRPPTQAYIIGDFVYVDAWAPATGSATFATRTITDPEDRACPAAGEGVITHSTLRDGQVFVSPIGVYDPSFNRKISTWVALPPGALMLVCTTIHTGTNQGPLATDTHLLQGGLGALVRVIPQGIDMYNRTVDAPPPGSIAVTIGSLAEGCGQTQFSGEITQASSYPDIYGSLDAGQVVALDTEVTCRVPLRSGEFAYSLPITVSWRGDGDWVTTHAAIYVEFRFERLSYTLTEWSTDHPLGLGDIHLRVIHENGVVTTAAATLVASSDR